VTDTGIGMDADTISRVFEPFFTTKELGKGTGLGLSTVYGIVKQNEGLIDVASQPGVGTCFRLYFPQHDAPITMPTTERVIGPLQGRGETVLLVEDEPAILAMVAQMLERLGYRTLAAATPGEAMKLAAQHAGAIELLITDVVMPDMNGRDLADQLLGQTPGLRCLFTSGYTADVIATRGVLDEGVAFIQKPFVIGDLAARIRSVLET
jgi:two-component system, cell cycle sensor histidine kinase and response regulator CckA